MNVAIIGANGAIGSALVRQLAQESKYKNIYAFARQAANNSISNVCHYTIDYSEATSISAAADLAANTGELDLVIVTVGMLHDDSIKPEKNLQSVNSTNLEKILYTNTIIPSLVAKFFLPKLKKNQRSVFAALSARVGSISDNRLGGWYSYRMSKAALNMFIKTAAVEYKRTHKNSILVGIHPGTVDSKLSKPYHGNIPQDALFTPTNAAKNILDVIHDLSTQDTGYIWAWDGEKIEP